MGVVEASVAMKEREGPDSIDGPGGGKERRRSSAECSIVTRVCRQQRSSAKTGVVQRRRLQKHCLPTIRRTECVSQFAGIESVEPIPRVAILKRIWIFRSCLHLWQKHKAGKHGQDCSEDDIS